MQSENPNHQLTRDPKKSSSDENLIRFFISLNDTFDFILDTEVARKCKKK